MTKQKVDLKITTSDGLPPTQKTISSLIKFLQVKYFQLNTRLFRDYRSSLIYDEVEQTNQQSLIKPLVEAIKIANETELSCGNHEVEDYIFLNKFPGEHYRILNSLISTTGSKNIVEIGTATGLSSLAMRENNDILSITTYDIVHWFNYSEKSHFTESNMNKIKQIIGDLSKIDFFEKNFDILDQSDFIFMDGPKDGKFEYDMFKFFQKLSKKKFKYLFIDDIKFIHMTNLWASIESPKIDLSPFGHWTGSGLVDISECLKLKKQNV